MSDAGESSVDAALLLLDIGRPEEALQKLGEGFDASDRWCWYVRAAATLQLDRYADSIDAAQEGLALDAEDVQLLRILSIARLQSSDLVGAEKAILAALHIDAEDPDLLTSYAHVVARAGQMPKAEKLVARALAIDPEHYGALHLHALLATAGGDVSTALAQSRVLLSHDPENPAAHRLIGALHTRRGEMDAADEAFTNAVRLDPADHDTAEAAREVRIERHWLLAPLRLAARAGIVPLWLGAIGIIYGLRAVNLDRLSFVFSLAWITFCVYSWIVPPLLRRYLRRR